MKSKEEKLLRKLDHYLYNLSKKAPIYVLNKKAFINRLNMDKEHIHWAYPTYWGYIIELTNKAGLSDDEAYQRLWTLAKLGADSIDYNKMPVAVHRDNKNTRNVGGSKSFHPKRVRVPSLKRGKNTWKKFYKLYPNAVGKKTYMGSKLKKI